MEEERSGDDRIYGGISCLVWFGVFLHFSPEEHSLGDFFLKNDLDFMHRALELAKLGEGRTRPNPLVGAVLVKDGTIVGEGYHQNYGGPHAEIHALHMAGSKAKGSTLYVTLEPCYHHGKTPPCCQAVVEAGIERVVCAVGDPNPLVAGKGISYLNEHGVDTSVGLAIQEATKLNEIFFHHITRKRPFVILKSAMSLDGKIATWSGNSKWISSEASRQHVHVIRNKVAAIVVGVGTVLKDDPTLTTRLVGKVGVNPVRIVMDSAGRTPLDARLFKTLEQAPVIIVTTRRIAPERLSAYEQLGATVVVLDTEIRTDMVRQLLTYLGERHIDSVLVEGGGTLVESFIQAHAVDKYIVYIAPLIIGGKHAPTPVEGVGIDKLSDAPRFERMVVSEIGGDVVIEAYPRQSEQEAV
jgi:diaminohydroxyphosphoribosylaminopyrimidine deaminase/5-amino-6-(5-phosphoribosylamino)uracil reductase